jgi:predicted  nucleic acid-binding Zn ribbon protein
MYSAIIEISPKSNEDEKDYSDLLCLLLGCFRKNGQILGRQYPISLNKNVFSAYVSIPAKDSLDPKYNNKYVTDAYLELGGDEVITFRILGVDPESGKLCECNNRKSLIIFTNYLSIESPISCGNCFGSVPLYEIPKSYEDEYYRIICWESDYQACDQLQMNCAVGERFAINQMTKSDSALNKIGIEISRTLSEKCNVPVYYYLFKGSGKSHEIEQKRVCPSCSGEWLLEKPFHEIFDFKCENCNLLSNIAWNIR